jgi:hypothetical protein
MNLLRVKEAKPSTVFGVALMLILVLLGLMIASCHCKCKTEPQENLPEPVIFGPVISVGGLCCLYGDSKVAVDQSQEVYVAWSEAIRYTFYIKLKKSINDGVSFDEELSFCDSPIGGEEKGQTMVVDSSGNLFIAWSDGREVPCTPYCYYHKIYFSKSTDRGHTFSANTAIDGSPPGNIDQTGANIAINNAGRIYAAWKESNGGSPNIYLAKSTDGGTTFGTRVEVTNTTTFKSGPAMGTGANGNIYIAWVQGNGVEERMVYLSKSVDLGDSFSSPVEVDNFNSSTTSLYTPTLAVDTGGNIYIAWQDDSSGTFVIYLSKSIDGGLTFSTPLRIDNSSSATGNQERPTMAVDLEGWIYIAWQDDRNGNEDIYFSRSTDQGASFEPSIRVDDSTDNSGDQVFPHMAVDNSKDIYITWTDYGRGVICFVKGS